MYSKVKFFPKTFCFWVLKLFWCKKKSYNIFLFYIHFRQNHDILHDQNLIKVKTLLQLFFLRIYITVFVNFIVPPPLLELKKKFSDGSRRFEFEWVISGQGLKIGLALKSRFTRENLRFSKSFQTGQGCLSSRAGGGGGQ